MLRDREQSIEARLANIVTNCLFKNDYIFRKSKIRIRFWNFLKGNSGTVFQMIKIT